MFQLLYLFDGPYDLPHLVWLGFPFSVLNIDARVTRPGCLIDNVTRSRLPRFAKIGIAHFFQISKAYSGRLITHLLKNFFDRRHLEMVPLLTPSVKERCPGCCDIDALSSFFWDQHRAASTSCRLDDLLRQGYVTICFNLYFHPDVHNKNYALENLYGFAGVEVQNLIGLWLPLTPARPLATLSPFPWRGGGL